MYSWYRAISVSLGVTALLATLSPVAVATPPTATKCKASWYGGQQITVRYTAYGEQFDRTAMTTAARDWPHNTQLRVTNPATGAFVDVRVNDFGPNAEKHPERCLNLTWGAFSKLAPPELGVIPVQVEVLTPAQNK